MKLRRMKRALLPACLLLLAVMGGCAGNGGPVELTKFPAAPVEYQNYDQVYHPREGHRTTRSASPGN